MILFSFFLFFFFFTFCVWYLLLAFSIEKYNKEATTNKLEAYLKAIRKKYEWNINLIKETEDYHSGQGKVMVPYIHGKQQTNSSWIFHIKNERCLFNPGKPNHCRTRGFNKITNNYMLTFNPTLVSMFGTHNHRIEEIKYK